MNAMHDSAVSMILGLEAGGSLESKANWKIPLKERFKIVGEEVIIWTDQLERSIKSNREFDINWFWGISTYNVNQSRDAND